jgi:hypothetical protein
MSIINKITDPFEKGQENIMELNKADLLAHPNVVANAYYSDQNN